MLNTDGAQLYHFTMLCFHHSLSTVLSLSFFLQLIHLTISTTHRPIVLPSLFLSCVMIQCRTLNLNISLLLNRLHIANHHHHHHLLRKIAPYHHCCHGNSGQASGAAPGSLRFQLGRREKGNWEKRVVTRRHGRTSAARLKS